ncbi:MAG: 23S rRNA (guanosine(2251)-2'-O)-methyltransferase RlmB [Deltaproteobacteria bacterium]|nr:23S rRNA (guanosine(2251)-2'-O)-methyltransferase RlmB [Deltaproteobacteria bacterium]
MKSELLYGIHPVFEALAAVRRRVYEVYLDKEKKSGRLAQIASMAEARGVLKKSIAPGDFKALTGTIGHQGAAAAASPYPQVTVQEILQTVQGEDGKQFLLMLDNIQDPQNLGAIIRTALCVGIQGVIVPKDRSAPPTPAVSKASAGALEHIRLVRVTNLVQTIKHCKTSGLWIMGLQKDAAQSIYDADLSGSIALVLGGEQKGIRRLVKKNCDFLVSIPQQEALNSLNASVAAAVAMYEAFRQRNDE